MGWLSKIIRKGITKMPLSKKEQVARIAQRQIHSLVGEIVLQETTLTPKIDKMVNTIRSMTAHMEKDGGQLRHRRD